MDPLKMPAFPSITDRLNNLPPVVSPVVRSNELLQMLVVQQIETNQLLAKIVEKLDV